MARRSMATASITNTRNFLDSGASGIFSTDHKMIGLQYGITGLVFLFTSASCLMLVMRWQLAHSRRAIPSPDRAAHALARHSLATVDGVSHTFNYVTEGRSLHNGWAP